MKNIARIALLSAVALAGCNLTYDREGLKFDPPPSVEVCAAQGLDYCLMGTRAVCTDLAADALNCGLCGNVCGIGVDCISGACGTGAAVCGLIAGEDVCGTPEYPVCVDTTSDAKNCGACDVDCGTHACETSACHVTCAVPAPNECLAAGTWTCVDFQTDPNHCGNCTTACPSGTCTGGVCDPGTGSLTITARFPTSGANWNDWVQGADWSTATDAPCDAASTGSCIHAGELRQVVVTGRTSCTGLSATDALGAFDWACDASASPVRMVSTKLKTGKRLSDLVNASTLAWAINSVTVMDGPTIVGTATAASGKWWGNPVISVPPGGALASPGTIYVATTATTAPVIELTASRVALTIVPPAVLARTTAVTTPAVWATADVGSPRDFLWIEGAIDATNAITGVQLTRVRRSVVRYLDVSRTTPDVTPGKYGLQLVEATGNRIRRIVATRHAAGIRLEKSSNNDLMFLEAAQCGDGIEVDLGSSGNKLASVSVAANRADGLLVATSDDNALDGVVSSNNSGAGIHLALSARTKLSNAVAAFNAKGGVTIDGSKDCRVVGLTTAGNLMQGLHLIGSSSNVLMDVASNLDQQGAIFTSSSSNTVLDLAVSNALATLADVWSEVGSSNRFLGTLLVADFTAGASCGGDGSSDPGYDPSCLPSAITGSSFSLKTTPGWTTTFRSQGTVTADAVNSSFAGGAATITDLDAPFDWTGFENGYRAWGSTPAGSPLLGCNVPTERNQIACAGVAGGAWFGNAVIYDWSLSKLDTILREQLAVPLAVDTVNHFWSAASTVPTSTFQPHAMELASSAAGANNDLLCEVGETCLYMPNYGAYQGHGVLISVSGGSTPLWRYDPATNGY